MGGEPPRAIQHPAVIGLDGLRAPVTVVGEVLRCQRVCFYTLPLMLSTRRVSMHDFDEALHSQHYG